MRHFFARNLGTVGRVVRGLGALALLAGALVSFRESAWLGGGLAVLGVFAMYEALRGWCVLRACGVKTRF